MFRRAQKLAAANSGTPNNKCVRAHRRSRTDESGACGNFRTVSSRTSARRCAAPGAGADTPRVTEACVGRARAQVRRPWVPCHIRHSPGGARKCGTPRVLLKE
ncbi:hypothetical protein MTO96_003286 [Rhipicephalus appendiculatus]